MRCRSVAVIVFILLSMFFSMPIWAEDKAMEKEWLLSEEMMVISAAKFEQPLSEAPAIMTVISAEDIKNMGARDLKDVLKTVSNMDAAIDYLGRYGTTIRGIKTVYSEKVKLLINGHSVNDPLYGGATWTYDDLALNNVKRIEIIRGPGSALYGTNAFVGVINVITKDVEDIAGYQVKAEAGSFKTKGANILFGKKLGLLGISGYAEYKDSDGPKLLIERDSLSGTPLTHAPGLTNRWIQQKDFNLNLVYKNFDLKTKLTTGERGPYLGLGYAVNDETVIYKNQMFAELSHKYSREAMNLLTKIYWDQYKYEAFYEMYSEGFAIPGIGAFPDGFLGKATTLDRTLGVESQATYDLSTNNKLVGGIVFENINQLDATYMLNFHPLTYRPYGFLKDISGELNWQKRGAKRDVYALYLQDTFKISKDLIFTLGSRYDHYSDFGKTINPRGSLVWKELLPKTTLKVLYGTAFRSPNFAELYNQNNPAVVGNENLKPEKIKTTEASLGYEFTRTAKLSITYFDNTIKDLITVGPKPAPTLPANFINQGQQRVKGGEVEIQERITSRIKASMNYSYQKGADEATGLRIPEVPVQKGGLRTTIDLSKYVIMNSDLIMVGKRLRGAGDVRPNLGGYGIVNLNLLVKEIGKGLEISAAIGNLFDRKYADPSPATSKVPNDYPQEGRNIFVETSYRF